MDRKSKTYSMILSVILLMAAMPYSACSRKNSRAARASRDLAQNITQASQPDQNGQGYTSQIDEQRVYVDASVSMSGYVNSTNHSKFDDFIDEIGNVMPGCLLYKYGQAGEIQPKNVSEIVSRVNFGLELHKPGFYNLMYNPDDFLINALASEDKSNLSVLITDGVYSEKTGANAPLVVQAIQNWMNRGRVLGILVLRSKFKGPFYSENRRMMLPPVSADARPFYAFVFSPSEQVFKDLQERLQQRFPDMRTILFSDNAVTCTVDMPERAKGMYAHKKPPEVPYYWSMFESSLFQQKDPALLKYGIKFHASPVYPAAEFKVNIEPQQYRWIKEGFEKNTSGAAGGIKCEIKPPEEGTQPIAQDASPVTSKPDFVIHTLLAKDTSYDFSFYHLNLDTSFKSVRKDISDLSTRDDSVRENANKTYRIFELIDALTTVHFKARLATKISPSIFVTVANH